MKYDQIIDFFVRGFGSGAGMLNIVMLCLAALAALLLISTRRTRLTRTASPTTPDEELPAAEKKAVAATIAAGK